MWTAWVAWDLRRTGCGHAGLLGTSSLHASQRADSSVSYNSSAKPFDTKLSTETKECEWDAVCIVCALGCCMCRCRAATRPSPPLLPGPQTMSTLLESGSRNSSAVAVATLSPASSCRRTGMMAMYAMACKEDLNTTARPRHVCALRPRRPPAYVFVLPSTDRANIPSRP